MCCKAMLIHKFFFLSKMRYSSKCKTMIMYVRVYMDSNATFRLEYIKNGIVCHLSMQLQMCLNNIAGVSPSCFCLFVSSLVYPEDILLSDDILGCIVWFALLWWYQILFDKEKGGLPCNHNIADTLKSFPRNNY